MIWLRTLVFALTFVTVVLVLIPRWILGAGSHARLASGPALFGAGLLIGTGVLLMVWTWYEFATRGRGTPLPLDPPRRLVVAGPYRYVRNPMYVAAILVLVGEAIFHAALPLLWYAAGFALAAHALVIGYEERTLARRFGADYAAYRAAVGRWFPHRLRPYVPAPDR